MGKEKEMVVAGSHTHMQGPSLNTRDDINVPRARGRSRTRVGGRRESSPKPGAEPIQRVVDTVIHNSVEHIKSITDRLEARLVATNSDSTNDVTSGKRLHESYSTASSVDISPKGGNKSPILPVIKKFRSVVVGLSHPSVSRPKKQFKDPLVTSSPNTSAEINPLNLDAQGSNHDAGSSYDNNNNQPRRVIPGDEVEEEANGWEYNSNNNDCQEGFMFQYDKSFDPPYQVIMEGSIDGRNLGKYDPIAIGKLLARFIEGDRRIYITGRNQIKIHCNKIEDANLLLVSETLTNLGYRTLVPDSILYKRGSIRVRPEYSVLEIIDKMDARDRSLIKKATRRFNRDNNKLPTDIIDLVFLSNRVPRKTFIYDVEHYITPTIPPPKRCYYCQVIGHVSSQCRSTGPNCEFCGGGHLSDRCSNMSKFNFCCNCGGSHKSSSNLCPRYRYEFEIMKTRYLDNLTRREAKEKLRGKGIYLQVMSNQDRGGGGFSIYTYITVYYDQQ